MSAFAWWLDARFAPLARRFKAGSWLNRTIYRAGDYWWFYFCFKPAWKPRTTREDVSPTSESRHP